APARGRVPRPLPWATLSLRAPRRRHPHRPLFPYTPLFRSPGKGHPMTEKKSGFDLTVGIKTADDIKEEKEFDELVRKIVAAKTRSEEHTSELQSRFDLVCRLLLEKKKIRQ